MSKQKNTRSTLDKQLLAAFDASGMSRFELAKRSGVNYSAVHCWVGGSRGLTLTTASKICETLGLELRPARRKRK